MSESVRIFSLKRYLVARTKSSWYEHAIADYEPHRQNRELFRVNGWGTQPLCEIGQSTHIRPPMMTLVNPEGDHVIDGKELMWEGTTFNTAWVEKRHKHNNIPNICVKCALMVSLMERYDMPPGLMSRLIVERIPEWEWDMLTAQIVESKISGDDVLEFIKAKVPVIEWVRFAYTQQVAGLTFDAAKFLFRKNPNYAEWEQFYGWPIEWLHAHYGYDVKTGTTGK